MKKHRVLSCDCGENAEYLLEHNNSLMLLCRECLNEWIRMFGEGSLDFIALDDLEYALWWAVMQNNISVKFYEQKIRILMNQLRSTIKEFADKGKVMHE